jgi:hypothetical protein
MSRDEGRKKQNHVRRGVRAVLLLGILMCCSAGPGAAECSAQGSDEHSCGPDLTQWLLEEMNVNAASDEVAALYATRRPRTARAAADRLRQFAALVGPGRQWDHKGPILDLLEDGFLEGTCPAELCSMTITLCGTCYDYDVFSNIHYGYIGRVAGFKTAVLLTAPVLVQQGGETPRDKIRLEAEDTPAVQVGQEVFLRVQWQRLFDPWNNLWPGWVTREMLCSAIQRRSSRLKAGFVEPECRPCGESWLP